MLEFLFWREFLEPFSGTLIRPYSRTPRSRLLVETLRFASMVFTLPLRPHQREDYQLTTAYPGP